MTKPPIFDPKEVPWAQTVLFQALLIQLIESRALSTAEAQRVFDIALQRAKHERNRAPDAERLIQHVHDNMKWDDMYLWEAQMRNK